MQLPKFNFFVIGKELFSSKIHPNKSSGLNLNQRGLRTASTGLIEGCLQERPKKAPHSPDLSNLLNFLSGLSCQIRFHFIIKWQGATAHHRARLLPMRPYLHAGCTRLLRRHWHVFAFVIMPNHPCTPSERLISCPHSQFHYFHFLHRIKSDV